MLALAFAWGGCQLNPAQNSTASESRVERGELYQTGVFTYDQYFSLIYGIAREVTIAPEEQRAVCADLTYTLGLPPSTPNERIAQALHEHCQQLEKTGHKYRVEGYRAFIEGARPDDTTRNVGQALHSCLRGEGAVIGRLRNVAERTAALANMATTLAGSIDGDFMGFKRNDVHSEMAAAQRSLTSLDAKAAATANEAEKFVLDLTAAVVPSRSVLGPVDESGEGKGLATPAKKKPAVSAPVPPKKPSAPDSAAAPAKPAAPPKKEPAKPAAKPKSDDFDP